ncbi:hypothetical protein A3L09_07010 [Thermococcus profundus]|uniref:Uncharacterized protein n=1 Tax=Thermococcus profundus TaxID=49899 RepID=A0A2Z2MBZ0_THEPR|nr:hypothetical protein [Thermococcus profundus]ASJ03023.1 hypothetical protein A3L09_07010 [Thermococcus profundus]
MPYAGFARTSVGPLKTCGPILNELEGGFHVTFSKHHWDWDMPFGLVIAETDRENIAVRWTLWDGFGLRLEEIDKEAFEDFLEEAIDYIGGD